MQEINRIALGVQYDGAIFSGWQSQVHGRTVQDNLERAMAKFATQPLTTIAAGRTDTGVHALGQVVHFDTVLQRPEAAWVRGINTFLPPTIAVQWAKPMPATFHARFSAVERTYYYVLYVSPIRSPLLSGRAGWVYTPLDVAAMQQAAQVLIGGHDFSAFRASQCQAKSPIKQLSALDVEAQGHFIYFRFRANAFLHHMVRNIMGCLISVGRAQHSVEWLQTVLAGRSRCAAAPTFMADGLYLAQIGYPAEFEVPSPNLNDWPWSGIWKS